MTSILLTLLLTVAWVPWGEAGEYKRYIPNGDAVCATFSTEPGADNKMWLPRRNGKCYDEDSSKPEFQLPKPVDCLAKMEAAMRAMEPYSVVERQFRFINLEGRRILEIYLEDKPIPDKPGLYEASKQWDAAKTECWSKP